MSEGQIGTYFGGSWRWVIQSNRQYVSLKMKDSLSDFSSSLVLSSAIGAQESIMKHT